MRRTGSSVSVRCQEGTGVSNKCIRESLESRQKSTVYEGGIKNMVRAGKDLIVPLIYGLARKMTAFAT